jgi:hypothetical protein
VLLDPNIQVFLPTGVRQLHPEEWTKIKGLPKDWRPGTKALGNIVESPGAHEWRALGDFVNHLEASRSPAAPPAVEPSQTKLHSPLSSSYDKAPPLDWHWEPPDLGPESAFYHRQVFKLKELTKELGGPSEWITDNKAALARH